MAAPLLRSSFVLASGLLLSLACGGGGSRSDAEGTKPLPASPTLYLQTTQTSVLTQRLTVNEATGRLQRSEMPALAHAEVGEIHALVFPATGNAEFASIGIPDAQGLIHNAVVTVELDPQTGVLTLRDQDPSTPGLQGSDTLGQLDHLTMHPATSQLFGAERTSAAGLVNGGIGGFKVGPGQTPQRVDAHGDPAGDPFVDSRDFAIDVPTLALAAHPTSPFLYAINLWGCSPNQLRTYTVDASSGALSPMSCAPPFVSRSYGIDMAVDPSGRMLLLLGMGGTLEPFRLDPITGAPIALPLYASNLTASDTAQQILMHPSGRFVFVRHQSTLDQSSGISIFALDANAGALAWVGEVPTGINSAQAVLDPSGAWLAVLHMGAWEDPNGSGLTTQGTLTLLRFDPRAATLVPTDHMPLPPLKRGLLAFGPRSF